jgi:di/tricarboxylate transporter
MPGECRRPRVRTTGLRRFLTPIATPANMMIMGPGDYRFGDYRKLRVIVVALLFVVGVGFVPLVRRF